MGTRFFFTIIVLPNKSTHIEYFWYVLYNVYYINNTCFTDVSHSFHFLSVFPALGHDNMQVIYFIMYTLKYFSCNVSNIHPLYKYTHISHYQFSVNILFTALSILYKFIHILINIISYKCSNENLNEYRNSKVINNMVNSTNILIS